MGGTTFDSIDFDDGVSRLASSGKTFARSAKAASTGDYSKIAEILDPRKLKNGMRESCFAPGTDGLLSIFVSLDGTGSMEEVPGQLQRELPKLIDLLIEQQITDHPNVLFTMHDDERCMPPDAVFQMSQFEIGAAELLASLNEMIIPGQGGGNKGEAYHLSFYAAANHTHLEGFERDGSKGFFFMICDEEPFYDDEDPATHGTTPKTAKAVFGDKIQSEIPMLESVRKTCERYHVFIIRPAHTSHGRDKNISRKWQDMLRKAGENPQNVLEVDETGGIVSTIAMCIGRLAGLEEQEMVDVLTAKGATGVKSAHKATSALVPAGGGIIPASTASQPLDTGKTKGRKRSSADA